MAMRSVAVSGGRAPAHCRGLMPLSRLCLPGPLCPILSEQWPLSCQPVPLVIRLFTLSWSTYVPDCHPGPVPGPDVVIRRDGPLPALVLATWLADHPTYSQPENLDGHPAGHDGLTGTLGVTAG
jgi:hypothetical protein